MNATGIIRKRQLLLGFARPEDMPEGRRRRRGAAAAVGRPAPRAAMIRRPQRELAAGWLGEALRAGALVAVILAGLFA